MEKNKRSEVKEGKVVSIEYKKNVFGFVQAAL